MWVQEGSDCKDVDVEDESPLFSRFYQSRRKKQTTTIIGIPMRPKPKPKPKSIETKPNITANTSNKIITKNVKTPIVTPKKKANVAQDEKEMEVSETPDLKSIVVEKVSVPVSPAQFIENIGTKEEDDDVRDEINNDQTEEIIFYEPEEQDKEEQGPEEKEMFIGEFDDDDDDDIGDSDLDLTIIGKKLSYLFDAVPVFGDIVSSDNDKISDNIDNDTKMNIDGDDAEDDNADYDEKKLDFDEESKTCYYIPQAFNGLYVNSYSEWDECINFSNKNNGLLIVEIYSSMFGPSNVMYTMIDEILNKKENDKIKFVRLNSKKINEIDTIKEIIKDYEFYLSTPIPMYIFIKNGDKIDFLKGTQPKEFEIIIDKHLCINKEMKENMKEEEEEKIFKYKPLEYSSHLSIMNNKENESGNSNVENIKNLIKKLDIDHQSNKTTKLSKKSRSTGMSTQSMFS